MTDAFEVVGTRDIPAPLDAAWKSWTDPEYVLQWWEPNGFTCTVAEMDVRVGGRSLVCMSAADWGFPALYSTWTYTRVDAPSRLEFVHNMSDEHGTTIDAEGIPRDVRHVITFEAIAPAITRLTVRESSYPTAEARDMSSRGLEECLDNSLPFTPRIRSRVLPHTDWYVGKHRGATHCDQVSCGHPRGDARPHSRLLRVRGHVPNHQDPTRSDRDHHGHHDDP